MMNLRFLSNFTNAENVEHYEALFVGPKNGIDQVGNGLIFFLFNPYDSVPVALSLNAIKY